MSSIEENISADKTMGVVAGATKQRRPEIENLEFAKHLAEVERFLSQVPPVPKPLDNMESLTDEGELDKAISRKFSTISWASLVPNYKLGSFGQLVAGAVISIASIVIAVISLFSGGGLVFWLALSGGFLGCFLSADAPNLSFYRTIRNKFIMPDEYQLEIRRVLAENINKAARYQEQLSQRDKGITQANRMLLPLADQYSVAVPGKTLVIDAANREVVVAKSPNSNLETVKMS